MIEIPRKLTAETLRELLHYEPETGEFRWRVSCGRVRAGSVAGWLNDRGYCLIKLYGVAYQAHRLAWLYVHGAWPVGQLDHRDGNPNNNRLANLREATSSQNAGNSRRPRDNISGFKGVRRSGRRWQAMIGINGKQVHLGRFDDPEEAHATYCAAATRLFGEFARFE